MTIFFYSSLLLLILANKSWVEFNFEILTELNSTQELFTRVCQFWYGYCIMVQHKNTSEYTHFYQKKEIICGMFRIL